MTLLPLTAVALCSVGFAQREEAVLTVKKDQVTISYGVVPLGKHGLHALPAGRTWRMGKNLASTMHTSVPLLVGDHVVVPGGYRVGMHRASEKDLGLLVTGGAMALGGADVRFPGKLDAPKKPNKKLAVTWVSAKKGKVPSLSVHFGKDRVLVSVQAISSKSHKLKGRQASSYAWPAATFLKRLDGGQQTPVVGLVAKKAAGKAPKAFCLMVGKDAVRLVPQMTAPTDSFGFGTPKAPAAEWISNGSVQWSGGKKKEEAEATEASTKVAGALKVSTLKIKKGILHATIECAGRKGVVEVPLPKPKKK